MHYKHFGLGIGFRCHGCDSDEFPLVAVKKFFKQLVALKLHNLSKSSVSVDHCDGILLVDKRGCALLPIFLQNFGIVSLGDMWKMHKETKKWHDDSKDKDDSTVHFYQTTSCCDPNCKVHESSTSSSSCWDISVFLDTSKRPSASHCSTEHVIGEGPQEKEGTTVLQLPITNIVPDAMQNLINRCESL